ncbi:secretion protein HlyD [Rhodoferax koreense]|uniref:Secretion protein HlyD n=1 Tax=Rhodoferax koreensis TaxID=1842727 RepID=A0A1P8JS46_9BURK|nr:HlyD family efflux transporter periplasmic adaptor subunit [Rhodoferax koreense]APW36569.1 secretion protein HlyD [Rhodoferax koreense]
MTTNPTWPAWPFKLAALGLAGLLGACSGHDTPGMAKANAATPASAPNAPAGPRELAMARGKIEVQGGLLEVMAPLDGTVESLAVKEGDSVRRGQVLLKLAPEQARLDVALAQAELKLVQARQRAQAARLPAARQFAQRTGEAARAGALDPQRAEEALQAQRDIESAAAVFEAEAAVSRQKLAQAQLAVQRQTLSAAVDASVLRLNVQPGTRVSTQAAKPVMVLLPRRPLIVRAELNESYLAAIRPGTRASVSVDIDGANGKPPAPLEAHVVRLAEAYGASRLDDDVAARGNLRVVDCFLEFDAAPAGIRLSQNVRVSFHE